MSGGDQRFRVEAAIVFTLSAALLTCAWRMWLPLDLTEAFGFATGSICVWLVTRGNLWNWPVGLANNVVFALLFWKARLFADFGLQGVYFALGIWGWWQWLHGGTNRAPLRVGRTRKSEWIAIALFLTAGTWGLRELLVAVNGAAPFWDALTTTLCLAAQYLLCRKRLENWWLWIVADVIYVPLYFSRGLPLTAVLYAGFLGLCIVGLKRWSRELA
jgi:nicotinamide mononucleotide transporter